MVFGVDFDGTITTGDTRIWHNNTYTNDVFTPNHDVVNWVLHHRNDMYLILWTCRCGNALDDAIKYANSLGIYFDAINDNIVQFDCSNKIMADIYITGHRNPDLDSICSAYAYSVLKNRLNQRKEVN